MIDAARLDIDVNLQSFSQFLSRQGIPHQIVEESGFQVIRVAFPQQAELVQRALSAWQSGSLDIASADQGPGEYAVSAGSIGRMLWGAGSAISKAPVTAGLSFVCLLVALVSKLGWEASRVEFLFYPQLPVDGLLNLLEGINHPLLLLQSLTPMFLHFGAMHLIFNLLWLWYFGRQLEVIQSSWIFFTLVVITSFVANTAQYLASGAANFGGMSGVVYGLVGYAWILHNFVPGKRLMLNNSMFVVFIIMMVLMEVFASSWIATTAHAGGLVAGLAVGLLVAAVSRQKLMNTGQRHH